MDRAGRALGRVDMEAGLKMAPDRVRRVVTAHQVAVEEDVAAGLARGRDPVAGDRRR